MDVQYLKRLAWDLDPEELRELRDEFERVRLLKVGQPDFDERMPDDVKHLVAEALFRSDVRTLGRLSRINRSFRDVSAMYVDRVVRGKEAEMRRFEEKFVYLQPLLDFIVRLTHVGNFGTAFPASLGAVKNKVRDGEGSSIDLWRKYLGALADQGVTTSNPSKLQEWYEAKAPASFFFALTLKDEVYEKNFDKGATIHDIAVFMSYVPFFNERYTIDFKWNCKTLPAELCRVDQLELFKAKAYA